MARLEMIQKIEKLESRKTDFEKVLYDVKSHYFDKGSVLFNIESAAYDIQYDGEKITFNQDLMVEYAEKEIAKLEQSINDLIHNLKGGN